MPEPTTTLFTTGQVRDLVERMLKAFGRRLDLSGPFVDASLPGGERLHVVIPDGAATRNGVEGQARFAANVRGVKRVHGVAATTVLCSVLVVATGCGPDGVAVPPGADRLSTCDAQVVEVVRLESAGEPGCNLVGSTLLFPDGVTFGVPPVGNAAGQEDTRKPGVQRVVVNWGVPGVGAAIVRDGRLAEIWASSPDAKDLQLEALRADGVATS
ncbi:hypothetical protein [Isoptericola sp. NPDC057191]|uniref:hypothetical protein n=1 Tax=Isoptericola sp. NPDC057191 TaxID=3346041 RepID=UPI00363008B4